LLIFVLHAAVDINRKSRFGHQPFRKKASAEDLVACRVAIASLQRDISLSSAAMRATSSCSDIADKSSPSVNSVSFFFRGNNSSGSIAIASRLVSALILLANP
jgi:hypothetical protein